jgi:hypothetical protein
MSKKQTYIVQDSIMNGTVTIQTVISGIEANSFEEAKIILKRKLVEFGFQVNRDTDEEITYSWVPEGMTKERPFPTYGYMTYEPIHYIE